MKLTLGEDSADRKNIPVFSGVLKYAPAALAGVARISKLGNDKHNPGQELHHARGKSNDHGDCVIRHAMDVADIEAYLSRMYCIPGDEEESRKALAPEVLALLNEASQLAWRAIIWSQELHEKYGGAPLAPGARLPSSASQPPVDNAHVAPGCELFANAPSGFGTIVNAPIIDANSYHDQQIRQQKQDAAAKKRQESY